MQKKKKVWIRFLEKFYDYDIRSIKIKYLVNQRIGGSKLNKLIVTVAISQYQNIQKNN